MCIDFLLQEGDQAFVATIAIRGGLALFPSTDADLFEVASFAALSNVGLGGGGVAGDRLLDRIDRRCPRAGGAA